MSDLLDELLDELQDLNIRCAECDSHHLLDIDSCNCCSVLQRLSEIRAKLDEFDI